jgi:hypothetical protein
MKMHNLRAKVLIAHMKTTNQSLKSDHTDNADRMAEFDEAAVLKWVRSVPGLTAVHIANIADRMAEDEYEGAELVGCTAKMFRRLLKGSGAEAAVPLLLATRDAQLAAEQEQICAEMGVAATTAVAAAMAEVGPSCGVCFEPYCAGVVPRILVTCGHTFCEPCLNQMLRCAPRQIHHTLCVRYAFGIHVQRTRLIRTFRRLMTVAGVQADAGVWRERVETAGVPEVQATVRCQGRPRSRAADQL